MTYRERYSRKKKRRRTVYFGGTLLLLIGFLIVLAVGMRRYDGWGGLVRRVRVAFIAQQPHPAPMPTFVPAATVDKTAFVAQLDEIASSPTPAPALELPATAVPPTPLPPTATQTAVFQEAQTAVTLDNITHIWQTWNNCGPATLLMNLSYYGIDIEQKTAASILKPNPDDKNVNGDELLAYARQQGLDGHIFINGRAAQLKTLLSNGIPIILETWLEETENDGMGHYRLLVGYDDDAGEWIIYDSYISKGVDADRYTGIRVSYAEIEEMWHVFNHTYILLYPEESAAVAAAILGDEMDEEQMRLHALSELRRQVGERPNDPFVWFNLGSTLTDLGQYEQAVIAFEQARAIGLPWRMFWYQFAIFTAYDETERYQELAELTQLTIESWGEIEEVYYWNGRAQQGLGNEAGASKAFRHALELRPTYAEAEEALQLTINN